MKEYYYELSSFNIWASFDCGYVKANSLEEARKKAEQELRYNLQKVNDSLAYADVTKDFFIEMDFSNLEVKLEK